VDLILIEELGHGRPASLASSPAGKLLDTMSGAEHGDSGEPCDFLGAQGCTFPADLRPFGCAAAICTPMRQLLSGNELARVERAVGELTAAYTDLTALLHAPADLSPTPLDSGD
jgi:hypothetical protein